MTIGGSWLESITFDDKDYWDIDEHAPDRQVPHYPEAAKQDSDYKSPATNMILPSDWRYREDLIWLIYGFQEPAAAWKSKLEV